jgi:RNA polymerase sigma-70 factor (ECF subfamily)
MQEKGFDAKDDTRDTLVSGIDARAMLPKLDRLDEKYRQVVIMRYIDELSPKEIAEVLGDEENTVSVRLHRAIQKLRAMEK